MPDLLNLTRASSSNFLWPTIADAIDTFLRRRACAADSYERIWRLIHVWEAINITLAVAAISRYQTIPESDAVLRKCREYFYGMSWDPVTKSFKTSQGASDGSIDQWINILEEVSKKQEVESSFLKALQSFLDMEIIDLSSLVQSWSRSCDVPTDARKKEPLKVKQAIRYINSFRNRFAHVPFPHDPLDELATALENVTEQLFSVEPLPSKHIEQRQENPLKDKSSPLTGSFAFRKHLFRGNTFFPSDDNFEDDIQFIFPCIVKAGDKIERWDAFPFIYIDTMMRPHVISRVKEKEEQGPFEYTRFRAEANAVIVRYDVKVPGNLLPPKPSEYETEEEKKAVEDIKSSGMTFSEAIEATRQGNYDEPIAFFERLTKEHPGYHIPWLHLGHTKREKAVRLSDDASDEAFNLLTQAVEELTKSTEHKDQEYQARAFYERSKTHFHLAKKGFEIEKNIKSADEDAQKACELSSDPKYKSWTEYIQHSDLNQVADGSSALSN